MTTIYLETLDLITKFGTAIGTANANATAIHKAALDIANNALASVLKVGSFQIIPLDEEEFELIFERLQELGMIMDITLMGAEFEDDTVILIQQGVIQFVSLDSSDEKIPMLTLARLGIELESEDD